MTEGQLLGHSRLLRQLGQGGRGAVSLADETKRGRQVAVKGLPEALRPDPAWVARFHQAAQTAPALTQPHIATLSAMDEVDGGLFLTLEYVDGRRL